MGQWMEIFRQLLRLDPVMTDLINNSATSAGVLEVDDGEGGAILVERVKSQVCDNISLYATKYASDFTAHLAGFVKDVWEMLIDMKAQHAKYDVVSIF